MSNRVRKSGEPLLKILLQWKKISQGKNEHKSFLSSMISRRSYTELRKKKKKLAVGGKQKVLKKYVAYFNSIVNSPLFSTNFLFLCLSVLGNLESPCWKYCCIGKKIAQGKNEYQAFFIHCSLEEFLNSEKEIRLWFKLKVLILIFPFSSRILKLAPIDALKMSRITFRKIFPSGDESI